MNYTQRGNGPRFFLGAWNESHGKIYLNARDQTVSRGLFVVRLTEMEWKLFLVIATRHPAVVDQEKIIEIYWGDDENGGPDDPRNRIAVTAAKVNDKVAPLGMRLVSRNRAYLCTFGDENRSVA